ncbi:PREDICTED: radial spoke head 14 homolog [Myotis davidii]|uniref:radial spoke head 14 homolog n=1 Tax=Myotis davidii TaxID=225400 RepID=UPI0007676212|nr:PREDICTED: radial spoke head 14 homolog [Myotis davidii]
MAHTWISMYLPPDINPAQASIAYGCRALPKLNEELQSEDLQTRQKALMALCDLMHDPEHVYVAIDIGCLESLRALLRDTNHMVRIKTTEVLSIMATHTVGRWATVYGNPGQAFFFFNGKTKSQESEICTFPLNSAS